MHGWIDEGCAVAAYHGRSSGSTHELYAFRRELVVNQHERAASLDSRNHADHRCSTPRADDRNQCLMSASAWWRV
jgi:hypothetical protein